MAMFLCDKADYSLNVYFVLYVYKVSGYMDRCNRFSILMSRCNYSYIYNGLANEY